MTDEELESLVRDLKGDLDTFDTDSTLAPAATRSPAADLREAETLDLDQVQPPGEPFRDRSTTADTAVDTMSAEAEVTDVAALRLELAQAYLEIGEIDGAIWDEVALRPGPLMLTEVV